MRRGGVGLASLPAIKLRSYSSTSNRMDRIESQPCELDQDLLSCHEFGFCAGYQRKFFTVPLQRVIPGGTTSLAFLRRLGVQAGFVLNATEGFQTNADLAVANGGKSSCNKI